VLFEKFTSVAREVGEVNTCIPDIRDFIMCIRVMNAIGRKTLVNKMLFFTAVTLLQMQRGLCTCNK